MPDAQVEAIAERAHAVFNSGVDASVSPLSWKTETKVMRAWWIRVTRSVLDALGTVEHG